MPDANKLYQDYIRSKKFALIKALALKRCNNICECCMSRPARQVHHSTYVRLGDELLTDLICLCGMCHHRLHQHGRLTLEERMKECCIFCRKCLAECLCRFAAPRVPAPAPAPAAPAGGRIVDGAGPLDDIEFE
jgi:hypothetical protein